MASLRASKKLMIVVLFFPSVVSAAPNKRQKTIIGSNCVFDAAEIIFGEIKDLTNSVKLILSLFDIDSEIASV